MWHANSCKIERLDNCNIERLQHWTPTMIVPLNVRSTERLQRADHNWILSYYEMNFIMHLRVDGQ